MLLEVRGVGFRELLGIGARLVPLLLSLCLRLVSRWLAPKWNAQVGAECAGFSDESFTAGLDFGAVNNGNGPAAWRVRQRTHSAACTVS